MGAIGTSTSTAPQADIRFLELAPMGHGRADAVEPGALVGGARRGKGRAGQLLGIETISAFLRGIAADGQGTGQGLGLEAIAEARQVAGLDGALQPACSLNRMGWILDIHGADLQSWSQM
jgi:hypothetical protein